MLDDRRSGPSNLQLRLRRALARSWSAQLNATDRILLLSPTLPQSFQWMLFGSSWKSNRSLANPPYRLKRDLLCHFKRSHCRDKAGRFLVSLPRKGEMDPLGEFRSLAVGRFLSLKCSYQSKGKFQDLSDVGEEYFDLNHAEPVPESDLEKPCNDNFIYQCTS